MKTFLPLSKISILVTVLLTASAVAQVGRTPAGSYLGETVPGAHSPGPFDPANSPTHFTAQVSPKFPGNLWASYTGASEGVGWDTGGYFSLGAKTRLGTDMLDGRWLLEARGHLAHEQGNVFGNLGIERIFTIAPAKTDVGFNFFVDADGDSSQNFGHNFWSVGVGGFLRHEKFELRGNGYIPIGTSGYLRGDPDNCFFQHFILQRPGIDSALSGFDIELSLRPWHWQMLQGHIDVGGYYYHDPDADVTGVESFGGVRVRGRVTTLRGVSVEAEYNYDDRFKATLIGRVVISTQIFGQYGPLGRDLDRTRRNDHVVRVHQEALFLNDPDTGRPYQVQHVDNTAAPGGDGTFETPYNMLAGAEAGSAADDLILVREGDGTTRGYDTGIALKDGQMLLGDGFRHAIPRAQGGEFVLCNDIDGNKPTITAPDDQDVVTLANRNTVAGFTIDGGDPANNGIFGENISGGVTIRNNMLRNLDEDGVHINSVSGDIIIVDNMIDGVGDDAIEIGDGVNDGLNTSMVAGSIVDISRNVITDTGLTTGNMGDAITLTDLAAGRTRFNFDSNVIADAGVDGVEGDGIEIAGVTGPGGNLWIFNQNMVEGVGGDAIRIDTVAAAGSMFMFTENTTIDSEGNGIFLNDITDPTNTAIYSFVMNTSTGNGLDGINLTNFGGASVFMDTNVTSDNIGNGLEIADGPMKDPVAKSFLDVDILDHVTDANSMNGILLSNFDGDVDILGATITNNVDNGVFIKNVTNCVGDTSIDINSNLATGTASTIADNNASDTVGVRVVLNQMTADSARTVLNITDTTLDNSATALAATVSGAGNELRVTVDALPSISNHKNDVVDFDTLNGAKSTLVFTNNMNVTNNGSVSGDWLDLNVENGMMGDPSMMTVAIEDNTIVDIGGAGIRASVTGNSTLGGTFTGNMITNAGSFGATFNYNVDDSLVNTFRIVSNVFDTTGGDAVRLQTNDMSQVDFQITGNEIINPSFAKGIHIAANDSSMLRVQVLSNNLVDTTGTSRDGIDLAVADDAMLLGRVFGNGVTDFGGNGNTDLVTVAPSSNASNTPPLQTLDDPYAGDDLWGRGIVASATDDDMGDQAEMAVLIQNNNVSGSALEGIGVYTRRGGKMTALVIENTLSDNDVATATSTETTPNQTDKLPGRYDFYAQTEGNGNEFPDDGGALDDDDFALLLDGNFATNGYVAGQGPAGFTDWPPTVTSPTTPTAVPPMPGNVATMTLEVGSNNLDVRQLWLQGDDVIPNMPPPMSMTPPNPLFYVRDVFGQLGAPFVGSDSVMRYNMKVNEFDDDMMPMGDDSTEGPFDSSYPNFGATSD